MTFYECSACSGYNVMESMASMARWVKAVCAFQIKNRKTKFVLKPKKKE